MALHEDRRRVGVEADGEQHRCQLQGCLAEYVGLLRDRERM
jgi:hypothetical protein